MALPSKCLLFTSSLDKEQFTKMSEQMSDEDLPFVQLIMGTNGIYLNAIM